MSKPKAYVTQMGKRWYVVIQTPSGVWTRLAGSELTKSIAINRMITLGYEEEEIQ